MEDKDKLIKKLRNMKQYQNLSDDELQRLAIRKLEEKELIASFVGLKDDEIEKALSLYYKYLDENSYESLAEKSTLVRLVYFEIIKDRLQRLLKQESEDKNGAVNLRSLEELRELDTKITELKEKLGMMKNKNNDSVYQLWKELEEKCLKYYEEHAAEFQNKCPYCNKLFPSILPPEKLTPQVSSWFKGTDLYNEEVFNLYHNKIITEEQAAKILGVSKFYIPYIYQEIFLKKKNDN